MRLFKKPLPFMHITCSASHFRISVRLKKFNLIMLLIFETLLELKYRTVYFQQTPNNDLGTFPNLYIAKGCSAPPAGIK
jgi:hypothetical protein